MFRLNEGVKIGCFSKTAGTGQENRRFQAICAEEIKFGFCLNAFRHLLLILNSCSNAGIYQNEADIYIQS